MIMAPIKKEKELMISWRQLMFIPILISLLIILSTLYIQMINQRFSSLERKVNNIEHKLDEMTKILHEIQEKQLQRRLL